MNFLLRPKIGQVYSFKMYTRTHKGIGFTVESVGKDRWKWTVSPPPSVLGLKLVSGLLEGSMNDAIGLTAFLFQRDGGYCIADVPSRWDIGGAKV